MSLKFTDHVLETVRNEDMKLSYHRDSARLPWATFLELASVNFTQLAFCVK